MDLRARDALSGEAIAVAVSGVAIESVERSEEAPELPWIAPGFFDAQVNGYAGDDYSADGLQDDAIGRIVDALAASGTTQHLATIVTSPRERIVANLGRLAAATRASDDLAAAIPGFHVEGPFISGEDGPRGAHNRAFVRDPDTGELEEWHAAAAGRLRLVTLAPERQGAVVFIERARALGIAVAIGHTAADAQAIRRAVDAGAAFSTHLGNGSHLVLPRLRNYLWEQLACDELTAGLIPDGFHLPEPVMRVFARAKGLERLYLVSDVGSCAGLPPGHYHWGGIEVDVHPDGHLALSGTSILAGAGHLLDWGLAHFAAATGCSLAEAIRLVTARPARLFGLEDPKEGLIAGASADLVVFRHRPGADRLEVELTMRRGRRIHPRR